MYQTKSQDKGEKTMIHISWAGFGNELTMGRVSALTNMKTTFLEKHCG